MGVGARNGQKRETGNSLGLKGMLLELSCQVRIVIKLTKSAIWVTLLGRVLSVSLLFVPRTALEVS